MVERRAASTNSGSDAATVKQIITTNKMLLQRNIYDKQPDGGDSPRPDQVDLLLLIQRDLAGRAAKGGEGAKAAEGLMVQLCNELYLQDVLEQEGLEQWWEDGRASEGEAVKGLRSGMERFMGVLMAESESESDDDDDDGESEEESD